MTIDEVVTGAGPAWRAGVRGSNRRGHFLVVANSAEPFGFSAGVRHCSNTHWLSRAEGFSSDASAEAWGRIQLAELEDT